MLAYEGTESVEDVFCLNFAIVEDDFGQVVTKELKPGGENIAVTMENREEYVKLYCDHMLNKSVEPFFKAFHAGFHKVCGGRVLDLFHARELMTLVVGTTKCDWTEFENQTDYKVNNYFLAFFRVKVNSVHEGTYTLRRILCGSHIKKQTKNFKMLLGKNYKLSLMFFVSYFSCDFKFENVNRKAFGACFLY